METITAPEPVVDVHLKVPPQGRAPAQYGSHAYKFSGQVVRLLMARNWREVGRAVKYAYLEAPEASPRDPPFVIDVKIPAQAEVLTFAQQLYEGGEKWIGRWGEWEAVYRPANNDEFSWTAQAVDPFTATRIGSPVRHRSQYQIEPLFIVGSPGLWSATVRWINGNATYKEERQNIVTEGPSLFDRSDISLARSEEAITDEFYEGALNRVTANRYERDPRARQACIAHHGACCFICGFDFGSVYGEVAQGFIHVHHIAPISSIGEGYKVDPINDMIPVCPNCHAVFHLSDPPHTIDEVRAFIQREP